MVPEINVLSKNIVNIKIICLAEEKIFLYCMGKFS